MRQAIYLGPSACLCQLALCPGAGLEVSCRVRKRVNAAAHSIEAGLRRPVAGLVQVHSGQAADTSTMRAAQWRTKCSR